MTGPNAFAALLRRQGTAEQREYLNRVRADLRLAEDDALWALVLVVQEFCRELRAEARPVPSSAADRRDRAYAWFWFAIGCAYQTLIGSAAMYVGALAASPAAPPWMNATAAGARGAARVVIGALSAPAGWMAFAFAVPLALHGVVVGRALLVDGQRGLGRCVVALSTLSAAGCSAALWWLL